MASFLVDGAAVFGTIFLFELVDRTNFAVLGLSAKHPYQVVWAGAAVAFVVSTLFAVGVSAVLQAYLGAELVYVKVAGGIILVVFGLVSLLRSADEEALAEKVPSLTARQVFLASFSLILFLEMGDNTQILTILFVLGTGNLALVAVAASIALICVAAIGARGGHFLKTRVPRRAVERVSAGVLVLVGAATIFFALVPVRLPF